MALQRNQKNHKSKRGSQLLTFQDILGDAQKVTQLEALNLGDPIHIGACDAAKAGMDGVWFPYQGPLCYGATLFPSQYKTKL
jgi:hypothetical protein